MKLRHVVAAATLGAVSVVGFAGVAAAQETTTTPAPTAQSKASLCAKAEARLPKIQARGTNVEARLATLQTKLTTAQGKHQDDRAKLIQGRIDWLHQVQDHLGTVTNQITARCGT